MLYDESKHDEAVARRAKLEKGIEDVSLRMNDEQLGKDGDWTQDRVNQYMVLEAQHARLSRELAATDRELDQMERIRPREVAELKREPSVLERWSRRGEDGITAEEKREHRDKIVDAGFPDPGQSAAVMVEMITRSDNTSGQNAIDTETQPRIVSRLQNYGGARKIAQRWTTDKGNPIRIPVIDETDATGVRLGAQASGVGTEMGLQNIGSRTLGAFTYHSSPIQVTNEMIQDVGFDIAGFIEQEAVRRLGRITEADFTNGDGGASQPQGFATLATRSTTASSATGVNWRDLLNVQYAVDSAYLEGEEMGMGGRNAERGDGMVGYTMSRPMEQLVRQLRDGEDRPLWLPSIREGMPNMLHGYPYVLNYALPDSVATATRSLFFGNFHYFVVRSVQAVAVYDFWDSRTAQNNVREILAFCRDDSECISPVFTSTIGGSSVTQSPAWAALTQA